MDSAITEEEFEILKQAVNDVRKECNKLLSEFVAEYFVYDKVNIVSKFKQKKEHELTFTFIVKGIIDKESENDNV